MKKKRIVWNKNKKGYKLHSKESKQKIREALTGRKLTKETKKKISEANKDKVPWNKGKVGVYSEKTIKMKSDSLKGKSRSEEVKKIISEKTKRRIPWNKGKTGIYSEETKKKMSKALKGKIPWNKGIKNFKSRLTIKTIKKRYKIFSKVEEMRYNPDKPKEKEIQVHCKYNECPNSKENGGWFTPTRIQLAERIRQLENLNGNDGSYFYCSKECKKLCRLYNLHYSEYTYEEQHIFRQEVLRRQYQEYGYNFCEYCGSCKTLHVHHEKPKKTNPLFVLDPDNGVVLCKECHYIIGHKSGTECSTSNLANKFCS